MKTVLLSAIALCLYLASPAQQKKKDTAPPTVQKKMPAKKPKPVAHFTPPQIVKDEEVKPVEEKRFTPPRIVRDSVGVRKP